MYLIDGHNLRWAIQTMDDELAGITDLDICRSVGCYLRYVRDRGQIIFDGIGPPDKTGLNDASRLDVIFTGRDIDADSVIEYKIAYCRSPRKLVVVSSDRRVRNAARKGKATSIASEQFWPVVEKEITRKRPPKEPGAKRRGLTESETEQWMEFFGMDD